MGLSPDTAAMLFSELGRELRIYEDVFATIGLFYAGKFAYSCSRTVYATYMEHIWPKLRPTRDLAATLGPWAVVSGVNEPMGRTFAVELAKRGLNIFLLDSDVVRLKSLADMLKQEYSVNVLFEDVSLPEGGVVKPELERTFNLLDIGILVNSYELRTNGPVPFIKMTVPEIFGILNANIVSTTMLTHMVLAQMINRNRGVILNLAAFSGVHPVPFLSVYSATKAYIDFFSRSLNLECRRTNVRIHTMTPGIVYSEKRSLEYYGLLPTMTSFVANTLESFTITENASGSWVFAAQMWLWKNTPSCILRYVMYELMKAGCNYVIL